MDDTSEIIVEYRQNFHDWYDSIVAAGMISAAPYRVPLIYAGGCAVLAILGWSANVQMLASILTALALMFVGWAWKSEDLQQYEMRRRWDRTRSKDMFLRVHLSSRHITVESDQFHSQFEWSLVLRLLETTEMIILVLGTGNIISLPKRALDESARQRIGEFMFQNATPATGSPIGFGVVQKKSEET